MNASAAPAPGKYCAACGTSLDAAAAFCTRCGAPQAAGWAHPPAARSSGAGATLAVVLGVGVVVVLAIVGILAAIAIPNFIRYQLRARDSVVGAELLGLARAEAARRDDGGEFVAFSALPAGRSPGDKPQPWTGDDLAVAEQLGWNVQPPTYAVYAIEVGRDAQGNPSLSICAITDLDGDGRRAAWAVFLPAEDDTGAVTTEPPEAPCHGAVLARAGRWVESDPAGTPIRLSPDDVF